MSGLSSAADPVQLGHLNSEIHLSKGSASFRKARAFEIAAGAVRILVSNRIVKIHISVASFVQWSRFGSAFDVDFQGQLNFEGFWFAMQAVGQSITRECCSRIHVSVTLLKPVGPVMHRQTCFLINVAAWRQLQCSADRAAEHRWRRWQGRWLTASREILGIAWSHELGLDLSHNRTTGVNVLLLLLTVWYFRHRLLCHLSFGANM